MNEKYPSVEDFVRNAVGITTVLDNPLYSNIGEDQEAFSLHIFGAIDTTRVDESNAPLLEGLGTIYDLFLNSELGAHRATPFVKPSFGALVGGWQSFHQYITIHHMYAYSRTNHYTDLKEQIKSYLLENNIIFLRDAALTRVPPDRQRSDHINFEECAQTHEEVLCSKWTGLSCPHYYLQKFMPAVVKKTKRIIPLLRLVQKAAPAWPSQATTM